MLIAQATAPVPSPRSRCPAVPADLDAVVMRCLDRDPGRRYATAVELDQALAACADAGGWGPDDAATWWRTRPLPTACW
jgi:hypothetical protein